MNPSGVPRPVSARPVAATRGEYRYHQSITTRWMDNDAYGHVNNVHFLSYFDTVVNTYLIVRGALDIQASPVIGLVVETGCQYLAPLTYPETVTAGLRVAHVGRSSVRYEIALFAESADTAAAQGYFVHVYVDRKSRRPTELPAALCAALQPLRIPSHTPGVS
ncbi:MAG: acyl-CoA thioesterase [Pseudomonadota bacterium]|nr:acyl-CoA thioesterase [Pseudomonadota bacterium]